MIGVLIVCAVIGVILASIVIYQALTGKRSPLIDAADERGRSRRS